MKKAFIEMMSDESGGISTMRVMSFLALIMAFIVTMYGLINNKEVLDVLLVWLVAAFAPKAVQKFAETKNGIKSENEV